MIRGQPVSASSRSSRRRGWHVTLCSAGSGSSRSTHVSPSSGSRRRRSGTASTAFEAVPTGSTRVRGRVPSRVVASADSSASLVGAPSGGSDTSSTSRGRAYSDCRRLPPLFSVRVSGGVVWVVTLVDASRTSLGGARGRGVASRGEGGRLPTSCSGVGSPLR